MKLNNITVQIGGFHDHWLRNGSDNPTLLMAAMEYYHYDFIYLMDESYGEKAKFIKNTVEEWLKGKKVYLGNEIAYDWGHMLLVENKCQDYDLTNGDWKEEMRKLHNGGGFVALAHIGYPYASSEGVFSNGDIDEMIDNDYVDAVQLERVTDYKYVKKRAEALKRLPLVGGWDSHYITGKNSKAANLYSKEFTPDKHIDSAPGMRTIVIAEDNSFETIKKAVREGRCALEFVETGELFANAQIVDLLKKEGYKEKMSELDNEICSLNLKNNVLEPYKKCVLKFPKEGEVMYPKDKELTPVKKNTDMEGVLELDDIPMPVMQDESFVPFYWFGKNKKEKRFWAVRIKNDINILVKPIISNDQRTISVITKNDFNGTVKFISPVESESFVNKKAGEELTRVFLSNDIPEIFDIECDIIASGREAQKYNLKTGIAIAAPSSEKWEACPKYFSDSEEQCGGFGYNRPYPGKDVFSAVTQFKWDKEYFYMRSDITDEIQVLTEATRCMYRSECICLTFEPEFERCKDIKKASEFMLGFTDIGPVVWRNGIVKDATLEMEKRDGGRIVYTKIPWKDITDLEIKEGMNMGLHLGYLNDDGDGLIDNISWPMPAPQGKMETPEIYGVLHLYKK